jgi:hypothetical protein
MLFVAILIVVAVGYWAMFLPRWSRAIRTGRLLGRGSIYTRPSKMYWFGLISMMSLGVLLAGLAVWSVVMEWPL